VHVLVENARKARDDLLQGDSRADHRIGCPAVNEAGQQGQRQRGDVLTGNERKNGGFLAQGSRIAPCAGSSSDQAREILVEDRALICTAPTPAHSKTCSARKILPHRGVERPSTTGTSRIDEAETPSSRAAKAMARCIPQSVLNRISIVDRRNALHRLDDRSDVKEIALEFRRQARQFVRPFVDLTNEGANRNPAARAAFRRRVDQSLPCKPPAAEVTRTGFAWLSLLVHVVAASVLYGTNV